MKTRYKTFGEFLRDTYVAHNDAGGVKIICRKKPMVVKEYGFTPWKTKHSKTWHLVLVYIKTVLVEYELSNKIKRIPEYELLGKRCTYKGIMHVIANSWDGSHKETGESIKLLSVYPCTFYALNNGTHPITVTENDIQHN
jgi:hypothetical protein